MTKYPFKFLGSYTPEDTDIFFGRKDEIDILYNMVAQNSMLLVYGASGTGKTSLIQCGLAGRFKSYDWLALNIRRGTDINVSLKNILTRSITENGGEIPEEETERNLQQLIKAVYVSSFRPIYLIFDQFEELYVLGTPAEQQDFIKAVKEILKSEQPVKMIFSIREEYLGYLYEFETEVPDLLRKKLRIEPMTEQKVIDVLEGINNFSLSNVKIEADLKVLTREIFKRLNGEKKSLTVQLPYLQVFLDKLYMESSGNDKTHQKHAVITMDVLKGIGNIGDVLRNFLEEQVKTISEELSNNDEKNSTPVETIWKILLPFCTKEGTKIPISKQKLWDDLQETDKTIDKNISDKAVELFVTNRILNISDNLYELAHDSLALHIATKRSEEQISLMEVKSMLKNQVSMKAEARENFTEKQIIFLEPFLPKIKLEPEEDKLIESSRKAIIKQKNKQKRGLQITFASMAVALALMIMLSIWAVKAKRQAEIERIAADSASREATLALEQMNIAQDAKDAMEFNILASRANIILKAGGDPGPVLIKMDSIYLKNDAKKVGWKNKIDSINRIKKFIYDSIANNK